VNLDEMTARDELRAEAQERAVRDAARLLGVTGNAQAISTLHVLYQFGYMAGVLRASRQS
jgi:RNase P/RNase MRP subunit POP5